jgi:hypothetical protein
MLAVMAATAAGNHGSAIGARNGIQVELTAMGVDRRLAPRAEISSAWRAAPEDKASRFRS